MKPAPLVLAAALHDLGKIAVPAAILRKEGPLTPPDCEVVRRHPRVGHDMLAGSGDPLLRLAALISLTHHERVDGTGYPGGAVRRADPGRREDRRGRGRLRRAHGRAGRPGAAERRRGAGRHGGGARAPFRPAAPGRPAGGGRARRLRSAPRPGAGLDGRRRPGSHDGGGARRHGHRKVATALELVPPMS
ncbi:MAG: HD domain-containing protein, partial [Thermoleophilia bacterium]|nr:HD domain-containing protein [Thermoleophilia bacterium]